MFDGGQYKDLYLQILDYTIENFFKNEKEHAICHNED